MTALYDRHNVQPDVVRIVLAGGGAISIRDVVATLEREGHPYVAALNMPVDGRGRGGHSSVAQRLAQVVTGRITAGRCPELDFAFDDAGETILMPRR
jgi:hypothetical protein